jgi:hypothetical protein
LQSACLHSKHAGPSGYTTRRPCDANPCTQRELAVEEPDEQRAAEPTFGLFAINEAMSAPQKRNSRGKSPLEPVLILVYYEQHEDFQRLVELLGPSGQIFGQQTMIRTLLGLGYNEAARITDEWIADLFCMNPTLDDRARKRRFKQPDLPIEPLNESTLCERYKVYLRLNDEAESAILQYSKHLPARLSAFTRPRLPKIVRQIFLRQALVEGMKLHAS